MRDEVTVVVADDHAGYRAGLIRAIGAWTGLRLVGEAGDGASALRLIEEVEPDVALIDVRMPELNGLELCAQLAPEHRTRVLLLSAFVDDKLAARATASGAADCVSKQVSRTQICRRIEAVAHASGRASFTG
jgi:DNA-binding NarL/FixJ family response regulator